MVTIMLVITALDVKTGLRKNVAVFNGAAGALDKLRTFWMLIQDSYPQLETFKINSLTGKLSTEEANFVAGLVKELEEL